MFFVAFVMVVLVQCLYGSDDSKPQNIVDKEVDALIAKHGFKNVKESVTSYQTKINQGLLELIADNDPYCHSGKNLTAIKTYLDAKKSLIDFTCAGKVAGLEGFFTPLGLACSLERCSSEVVEQLCKAGANPNVGGSVYPGTYCVVNSMEMKLQAQAESTNRQFIKLVFLKDSCRSQSAPVKLLLNRTILEKNPLFRYEDLRDFVSVLLIETEFAD